jgi:hypothetical protein
VINKEEILEINKGFSDDLVSTSVWEFIKDKEVEFAELIGKTLVSIHVNEDLTSIHLQSDCGALYKMYHEEECCESVLLDDIDGSLFDLLGAPILGASVATSDGNDHPGCDNTSTWTFYKLKTIKGYVTIKWYGTSNGYYSEEVDFVRVVKEEKNNVYYYDDRVKAGYMRDIHNVQFIDHPKYPDRFYIRPGYAGMLEPLCGDVCTFDINHLRSVGIFRGSSFHATDGIVAYGELDNFRIIQRGGNAFFHPIKAGV